jgi:hypothetical protein
MTWEFPPRLTPERRRALPSAPPMRPDSTVGHSKPRIVSCAQSLRRHQLSFCWRAKTARTGCPRTAQGRIIRSLDFLGRVRSSAPFKAVRKRSNSCLGSGHSRTGLFEDHALSQYRASHQLAAAHHCLSRALALENSYRARSACDAHVVS